MRTDSLLRRLKTLLHRSVPSSHARTDSFPEDVEREQLLPYSAINSPRRRARKHAGGKTLSWLPRVLTFNFYTVHLAYIFSLCVLGGIFIYVFELYEDEPLTWVDALFTATSAACVTGLSSRDFSRLTLATKLISALLTTLGSHTVMALVPILVRRHIYRQTQGRGIGRSRRRVHEMSLQFEGRVVNEAEYDALGLLQWIIVIYIIGIQTISFAIMAIYTILNSSAWKTISHATPNKHSPITVLLFHSIFSFHNAGLSLLEDSLVPIANNRLLILTHAFLITCGNVLFPVFLRITVWIGRHWWDRSGRRKVAFRYLLRNPRRCSTHLFPSVQTRVLGWIWLLTNSAEYVAFLALDFSGIALAGRPASDRYLDGFFQSISTRTAGYNIAEISLFSPAMHVLWVMLMYLSSYPFVLTMRQTATKTAPPPTFTPLPSPAGTRGFAGLRHRGSISGSPMYPRHLTPTMPAFYLPDANDHGSHRFAEPTVEMWSSEEEGGDSGEESDGSYANSPLIEGGISSLLVPPSPTARAASELAGTFKGLMLRDATWLYTALFMICAIEGDRMRGNVESQLTVFAVAFEVVSGYGTVGLSMGPTGKTISLSALLSPASKLIVTVIMLMGRHRGLPDSLDAAVPEIDLTRPISAVSTPGRVTPNDGSPAIWHASQTLLPRNVHSIRSEARGNRVRPALVEIQFPTVTSSTSNVLSPSENQVASASTDSHVCIPHIHDQPVPQTCTSDRIEGGSEEIPILGNSSFLNHSTDTRSAISKTFCAGRLYGAAEMVDEDDEDKRQTASSSWTPGTLLMYHHEQHEQQRQRQQQPTTDSSAVI